MTNAEIAVRLFVSERTVESHVSSLLRKLHASNRRELIRRVAPTPMPYDMHHPVGASPIALTAFVDALGAPLGSFERLVRLVVDVLYSVGVSEVTINMNPYQDHPSTPSATTLVRRRLLVARRRRDPSMGSGGARGERTGARSVGPCWSDSVARSVLSTDVSDGAKPAP